MESNKLAQEISDAISSIRDGRSTPKDTKIGKLFAQMKAVDESEYTRLAQAYKPVAYEYFQKHPVGARADRILERELSMVESVVDEECLTEEDFDGPLLKQQKKEKIVSKVKARAKKPDAVVPRDRKSFVYMGVEYGKGPLVLAVIREHSKGRNLADMKTAFPDDLLKGYGIFKTAEDAREISKVRKRFFLNEDQLITLKCGNKIAVWNQFTSDNIGPFLKRATELNHKIE